MPPESGEPPLSLDAARARFGDALERHLRAAAARPGLIGEMNGYHLNTGGKRLRALMPVWTCVNLGGEAEAAIPLGVGLELVHNATLVHDDFQDGDTTRRGQPTVWVRWGAAQAINAGSALYWEGVRAIAAAPVGPRILSRLTEFVLRIVEGQTMEFQLQMAPGAPEALEPTIATYEDMALGKTGALMGACLYAGAAAAGLDDSAMEAYAAHGQRLGLLFQVQDDLLDIVGDKGRERRATDLAEGKLSYPVVWALEHAAAGPAGELAEILATPRGETSDVQMDRGVGILERSGAVMATVERLRTLVAEVNADPRAGTLPGLAERFLAPVAHVL